jgi:hypothetical protein
LYCLSQIFPFLEARLLLTSFRIKLVAATNTVLRIGTIASLFLQENSRIAISSFIITTAVFAAGYKFRFVIQKNRRGKNRKFVIQKQGRISFKRSIKNGNYGTFNDIACKFVVE